jgi:hypothetical protein
VSSVRVRTLTRRGARAVAKLALQEMRELPREELLARYIPASDTTLRRRILFGPEDPSTGKAYVTVMTARPLPRSDELVLAVTVAPALHGEMPTRPAVVQRVLGAGLRWAVPVTRSVRVARSEL